MLRERILVEGMKGSGKSYQWLKMAKTLKKATFYCLDTDDAIERMMGEEFPNLENVKLWHAYDWPDYKAAADQVVATAGEGDWIVVDMVDNAWRAVQSHFVQEVFNKDIGDYFLEARQQLAARGDKTGRGKEAKNLQALRGWLDWPVINRMYDSFILPLVYRSKAHLYFTASTATISEEDNKLTRELYGPFGVRPGGQKNLPHQVHTELLFQQGEEQKVWLVSTIKDRGRKQFDHDRMIDFPLQYLVQKAGWEL